ncbi:putative trans-sialidase [Trypanosoma cruzi]|nr:putative trans-sialidase [Trypanosoma cruzi]
MDKDPPARVALWVIAGSVCVVCCLQGCGRMLFAAGLNWRRWRCVAFLLLHGGRLLSCAFVVWRPSRCLCKQWVATSMEGRILSARVYTPLCGVFGNVVCCAHECRAFFAGALGGPGVGGTQGLLVAEWERLSTDYAKAVADVQTRSAQIYSQKEEAINYCSARETDIAVVGGPFA